MIFEPNENSKYKKILDQEKGLQRLPMHSFHRYYGKLIPAIPSAFIKEFTSEGDLIFDPFSGSGTTAVESLSNNRNFFGIEINPLAQKIASVKTFNLKTETLLFLNDILMEIIKNNDFQVSESDLPFLQNRDHWFKDFVQIDLIKIEKSIDNLFNSQLVNDIENKNEYKLFYQMTISAILRNVSNADTMHVFPGISKRMRALEAEGKIHIDVIASFEKAIKKRASYYTFNNGEYSATIALGDSTSFDLSAIKDSVDLIVTNPPYISSVRYIETLKLEMYWMKYIKNQNEYSDLAHKMLGNDRLTKTEYSKFEYTNYDEINKVIDEMVSIDLKSAKIISDFFISIEKVIKNMSYVLKSGGKAVIKISDSKMKKKKIETGKLMTLIAEKNGFELFDLFTDKINDNSRSLLTARNTYSDIITHDYIIIWEKK
ncbi:MAG: DNA methyltransferase [Oscillospiraceae bacterium]